MRDYGMRDYGIMDVRVQGLNQGSCNDVTEMEKWIL
jgi:hypothetical protein